ncbi:MAG: HAD family hydrolase [Armatimonadota bacterium]
MFSNTTAVLFDLDGTIADTNEIIQRTILETLEQESGRPWQREELLIHWGMRLRDQLQAMYPPINLERAVPFYRRRYAVYHEALLAEFPGMRVVLERLRQAGYQLGVVTSKKQESAHHTLHGLGYADLFPVVVVEEDTPRHKPAPDPLLYAAQQLHLSPEAIVYVGDNPDDIRAAHAAGMKAIAVGWCFRDPAELLAVHPDAMIQTPEDLLELLTGARASQPIL